MHLLLNGQPVDTVMSTLETLLEEQQIDITVVACAIDGQYIPKSSYSTTLLTPNMRVEVLSPMQGG